MLAMNTRLPACALAALILALALPSTAAAQTEITMPVLAPITGFLTLEGTSQRNGALLAIKNAPPGVKVKSSVTDTGTSPEGASTALERVLSRDKVTAVAAPILGPQMLAMMPIALENKVPLTTISGTAELTEKGNPYLFRFFPDDAVAKAAQTRYVLEELKKRRVALVYQTTAYGQGGRAQIVALLKKAGLAPVMEEGLEVSVKDFSAVLGKLQSANPDVIMIHLHGGPSALFLKQVAAANISVPVVAGSAISQPPTVALLEPRELQGVCAETNASPVAMGNTPEMNRFLEQYRQEFKSEPDGFAVAQYDASTMVIEAAAKGVRTPQAMTDYLAAHSHAGLAMTYKSDGKGNMAHASMIICYDGGSRTPRVVKRYS